MRKIVLGVTLLLSLLNLTPAYGTAYERVLCPPGTGTFQMTDDGLVVTVVSEDGKSVKPHTELLANPLTGKDAEAMTARGLVQFNSHIDKASGRVFVHWETVKPAK